MADPGRFGLFFAGSLAAASCAHSAVELAPAIADIGTDNQLGLTFSPDGTTAFWVAWDGEWGSSNASPKTIYSAVLADGAWSAIAPAPFSANHSDDDPFVSPDGRWLYFVSNRPTSNHDIENDANIWRYSLSGEKQLEVVPVNSDAEEYSPVITESGALYFASDRDGGSGRGDLYRANALDDGFATPEALGPALNSATGEWNLWVSADEKDILFEASSRPTNVSIPGDLYYSWYRDGEWSPAIAVSELNTRDSDLMPRLHPDGETLYYTTAPIGGHARIVGANWQRLRARLRATICGETTDLAGADTRRCSE